MSRDEALALADRILALVNAQPATPRREELADTIEDGVTEKATVCAHCGTAWNEGQGHANCPPEFRRSVSEDGGIELTPEEAAELRVLLQPHETDAPAPSCRGVTCAGNHAGKCAAVLAILPAGTIITDEVYRDLLVNAGEALKRDAAKVQEQLEALWAAAYNEAITKRLAEQGDRPGVLFCSGRSPGNKCFCFECIEKAEAAKS